MVYCFPSFRLAYAIVAVVTLCSATLGGNARVLGGDNVLIPQIPVGAVFKGGLDPVLETAPSAPSSSDYQRAVLADPRFSELARANAATQSSAGRKDHRVLLKGRVDKRLKSEPAQESLTSQEAVDPQNFNGPSENEQESLEPTDWKMEENVP